MDTIAELATLLGPENVTAARDALDRHSHDAWPVSHKQARQGRYPHRPDAVVLARDTAQVVTLLRWANQHRVAVTPWGLGSAVTGAPLALHGGVSLDMSTLDSVLTVDKINLTVTASAGVQGGDLEAQLNQLGYTLGHSPQSLHRSTVGGWLATRATGQFSSAYGGIEDLVVAFTVVLANGDTLTFPCHPRAAMGPDLRHLFLGSEGTLGVLTEATLRIAPVAEHRQLQAVRFSTIAAGLAAMRGISQAGLRPYLARFYDQYEARRVLAKQDFDGCLLFLGTEGPQDIAEAQYRHAMFLCTKENGVALGDEPVASWLLRRFDFSMIESYLDTPGGYAETIEIAHNWSDIERTYNAITAGLRDLGDEVLGHFSHIYPQGTSLYLITLGELSDDASAEARIGEIWSTTMSIAHQHGAALAHHHGVGLARLPYLGDALGGAATLLDNVKNALDPHDILNPGKLRKTRSRIPSRH